MGFNRTWSGRWPAHVKAKLNKLEADRQLEKDPSLADDPRFMGVYREAQGDYEAKHESENFQNPEAEWDPWKAKTTATTGQGIFQPGATAKDGPDPLAQAGQAGQGSCLGQAALVGHAGHTGGTTSDFKMYKSS